MIGPVRVAVFGPESTGKTQLSLRLAEHFSALLVAEYAREFWNLYGKIELGDISFIAREQWRREDIVASAKELVICDTEALTTVLWSDLLYGSCPEEVQHGAEKRCRSYALYLLLDADVPFALDPQRCFPDPADRAKLARVWLAALERRHIPFVWIRGDWAERERTALAAVEQLMARVRPSRSWV